MTGNKGVRKKVGLYESITPDMPVEINDLGGILGRYAFAAEFTEGKVVLDVACGSGYGSAYLCDKGARAFLKIR